MDTNDELLHDSGYSSTEPEEKLQDQVIWDPEPHEVPTIEEDEDD